MTILNINSCMFGGRLVADPELQQTPSGVSYVHFTLAVEDGYPKKDAKEKSVQFPNCTAWRNDAEFLCKHAQKGDVVMVTSEFKTRAYTDEAGVKRWDGSFTVKLGTLKIVHSKRWDEKAAANRNGGTAGMPSAPTAPAYGVSEDFAEIDDDGDLPF